MIAIFDFSIVSKSAVRLSPRRSLSSTKESIPLRWRAFWRWPVKLLRVSAPLKLRNTSSSAEEEGGDSMGKKLRCSFSCS